MKHPTEPTGDGRWAPQHEPQHYFKDEDGQIVPFADDPQHQVAKVGPILPKSRSPTGSVGRVGYALARNPDNPKKELTLREAAQARGGGGERSPVKRVAVRVDQVPRHSHAQSSGGTCLFFASSSFFHCGLSAFIYHDYLQSIGIGPPIPIPVIP